MQTQIHFRMDFVLKTIVLFTILILLPTYYSTHRLLLTLVNLGIYSSVIADTGRAKSNYFGKEPIVKCI